MIPNLCPDCAARPIVRICEHCGVPLCSVCLANHELPYPREVKLPNIHDQVRWP